MKACIKLRELFTDVNNIKQRRKRELKIITIANRKGGTGKTTCAYNLAWTYAVNKKKVCLIDLDSQANLSMLCKVDPISLDDFKKCELFEMNEYMDILPATKSMPMLENEIQQMFDRYSFIKDSILPKLQGYDYIIFDTSPSLSIVNINAFMVSDNVHVIINPDTFSYAGLVEMKEIIEQVRTKNTDLKYSIVLNGHTKNRKLTGALDSNLEKDKAFSGITIPNRQHIIDSIARKKPAIDKQDIKDPFFQLAEIA